MNWFRRIVVFAVVACFFCGSVYSFETLPNGVIRYKNIAPGHSGKKIALVTFISEPKYAHISETYAPYPEVVRFGTRSKVLYCQKHGYDFIIGSQKMTKCLGISAPNKKKLSIHWMKVPMMGTFLSEYDWVVWTDADSIFLNPEISLESLIQDKYDVIFGTFGLTQGARGTGHIYVKNCEWSRQFLKEWWSSSKQLKEGQWDLERLNDFLKTKPAEYFEHLGHLPVKLSDLSPDEFRLGDFLVHFYSYHGKYLYKIFKVFEEKYSYIVDNLEEELFEDSLLHDRYTDHVRVFKEIFASRQIRGVLEFGLGSSTRFFLNRAEKVISVEFITKSKGPDFLNHCLKLYNNRPNWFPIAYLSGCTKSTYLIDQFPCIRLFQGSTRVYEANVLLSNDPNRALLGDRTYYKDLEGFTKKIISQNQIDLAFVDSALNLRGELVESLFNKAAIIVAHDFPADIQLIDPSQDRYGYTAVNMPANYESIYFGPPLCQEGLIVWINRDDRRAAGLMERLRLLLDSR